MIRVRLAVIVAVVLAAAVTPTAASADSPKNCTSPVGWKTLGYGKWASSAIDFRVTTNSFPHEIPHLGDSSPTVDDYHPVYHSDRILARIYDGVSSWNNLRNRCGYEAPKPQRAIFVAEANGGSDALDHEDDINTIDFRGRSNVGTSNEYLLDSSGCRGSGVIGCAYVRHNQNGIIREFDISFEKHETQWWTGGATKIPADRRPTTYDLWTTTMHEIGHALGFAHIVDRPSGQTGSDPDALKHQIMYPISLAGVRIRNLGTTDFHAYCHEYCF